VADIVSFPFVVLDLVIEATNVLHDVLANRAEG
jgi:hypothetical protein